MTALSADTVRSRKNDGLKSFLMGTDILYKGAMVTVGVDGLAVAGQATVGHKFVGVSVEKVDDSAGAGTKWCRVFTRGLFKFTATSIAQTMVGKMMYLQDDNTIDDVPATVSIPCGILVEYVSGTIGWVDIEPAVSEAPAQVREVETITANRTLTVDESGLVVLVGTDALTITLPATKKGTVYTIVNIGADAGVEITISPNASDGIYGNLSSSEGDNADATTAKGLVDQMTGTDDGDLVNTKATALKGDRVTLVADGADGWWIIEGVGVWVGS